MIAAFGRSALLIATGTTAYVIVAFLLGRRPGQKRFLRSARAGVMAVVVLVTLASLALLYALVVSDFSIAYVAEVTGRALPIIYKVSALWAHNAGSMLLWAWVLALGMLILFLKDPDHDPKTADLMPLVGGITSAVLLFFLLMLDFVTQPFVTMSNIPPDGAGLNPLLQNAGMVIHPTTTYLGYAGFTIPFAYAIAALIVRRADDAWMRVTRRWTLLAWVFLSVGMIFGAQWAYVELGWGGYWAWDPVENASLMPWLTATAFFHSVMVQERKGMLKVWNVVLIVMTFILTLFGTFLSRSGVLASVHAFNDTKLGAYFTAFMGLMLAFSLYLIIDRRHLLKEEHFFEAVLSKESSFLANNLLLVGSAFTVLWGTAFPLLSEAVTGQKVTVGPPYFNQVNVPIGLALVLLIGVCPLIAWRKASPANLRRNFLLPFALSVLTAGALLAGGVRQPWGLLAFAICAFVIYTIGLEIARGVGARRRLAGEGVLVALGRLLTRNRRRYGGYLVHIAVVLMVIGFTGSSIYQKVVEQPVVPGDRITIGRYVLTYMGLGSTTDEQKEVVFANIGVKDRGRDLGVLRPSKEFHVGFENPTTEVAIKGGLDEDLFVILGGWEEGGIPAVLKILVNPLVAWIWLGEYLLVIGTVFAIWPAARRVRTVARIRQAARADEGILGVTGHGD